MIDEKKRYVIVMETNIKKLEDMVNDKIRDGYTPIGSIITSTERYYEDGVIEERVFFIQAMEYLWIANF